MTDDEIIAKLGPRDVVALTLYGEARNESKTGREAIAAVIGNRVKNGGYGKGVAEVCLRKYQFSCWTPKGGEANYQSVIDAARSLLDGQEPGPVLRECLQIAGDLGDESLVDPTKGAMHYLTKQLYCSNARPVWTNGKVPCVTIGHHVFFNDIDAKK